MDEKGLREELGRNDARIEKLRNDKEKYEVKLSYEDDPRRELHWNEEIKKIDESINELETKRNGLVEWLTKLQKPTDINIPFVIAAMTSEEASSLISGTALNGTRVSQNERDQFQRFRDELKNHGIEDLVTHYSRRREDWIPYSNRQETIEEIIGEICNHINKKCRPQDSSMVKLVPSSTEFFDEDRSKRLKTWDRLRRSGGVLIIDALSLHHPLIRHSLSNSGISSEDSVAMLVLSPVSPKNTHVNNLISEVIIEEMEYAYYSRYEEYDLLCWIGVGDLLDLKRCLSAVLQKEADNICNPKANPANIDVFLNKQGPSQGINEYVFNPLGER